MSPATSGQDAAALEAQFDAEVRAAGLTLSPDDRAELFEMWTDYLPTRASLQAAALDPAEEASFAEKPTQPGGGIGPSAGGNPTGPRGGGA